MPHGPLCPTGHYPADAIRRGPAEVLLADERQGSLGPEIRLAEHGDSSLLDDLRTGQARRFRREVRVADPRFGSGEVLDADLEVGNRVLQTVAQGA